MPKKNFPSILYPQIAQMVQNLCGIDHIEYLHKLVDCGLPQVVLKLLAKYRN